MSWVLTGHFYDISGDNVLGFNPLDALPVLTVDLPHLGLILLKGFDSIFSISFLRRKV